MQVSFNDGDRVRLKRNPNPVEVTYMISFLTAYIWPDGKIKVIATIVADKDYPLPDGGKIPSGAMREESIADLINLH